MKRPYFILPFDHRSTFAKTLLGFSYPTNPEESQQVTEMKSVVFDAFLEVYHNHQDLHGHLAILIDLEYGEDIITRCKALHIPFALSTEKSGKDIYTFEYGDQFAEVLTKELPTLAKALVRYNPANTKDNHIQRERLKQLSDFCASHQIGFMLEILVNGTGEQEELMKTTMKEMLADGITPTLWKLEGLDRIDQWQGIDTISKIDIVMLGRGENKRGVEHWVEVGAKSGIPDGFAIGRTIFFEALQNLRDKKITREEAVQQIAKNYLHFIQTWQNAQK